MMDVLKFSMKRLELIEKKILLKARCCCKQLGYDLRNSVLSRGMIQLINKQHFSLVEITPKCFSQLPKLLISLCNWAKISTKIGWNLSKQNWPNISLVDFSTQCVNKKNWYCRRPVAKWSSNWLHRNVTSDSTWILTQCLRNFYILT